MLKSSINIYLENAWPPRSTDATATEKGKPRVVPLVNTLGWQEQITSSKRMDNEGFTNTGIATRFTLGNWMKLPQKADDNNNSSENGEYLWIEGEKESDRFPTTKEFELDNGRNRMTVISMKSDRENSSEKTDNEKSRPTSSYTDPRQSAPKSTHGNEKQSQTLQCDDDESKLKSRSKDMEAHLKILTSKTQFILNETETKAFTDNNSGSKLIEDNWVKKMAAIDLKTKPQQKSTNCVRQMTQAIESKINRSKSFSHSAVNKLSRVDDTKTSKLERNQSFHHVPSRPWTTRAQRHNGKPTTFTSHLDTTLTKPILENTFSEKNNDESDEPRNEFPVKEFLIKTKRIGNSSGHNFEIIEIGDEYSSPVSPATISSQTFPSHGSSHTADFQKISNVASLEKISKSNLDENHPSRIKPNSYPENTYHDHDELDASTAKKTTAICVQLCPAKTAVRVKSLPTINPVAPVRIAPVSSGSLNQNRVNLNNKTNQLSSYNIDVDKNDHRNLTDGDDDTDCVVTAKDIASLSKSSRTGSSCLIVKEIVTTPSEDNASFLSQCRRKPKVLSALKDEECVAGEMMTLRCEIVGWPEPKVSWKFDGIALDGQEPYRISYDGRMAMLRLPELLPPDEGTYTCLAQNDVGQCETQSKLKVLGFAPDICEPPESVKARPGWPVSIKCRTKGNPCPKTYWTHNGHRLEPNQRIQLFSRGDLYVLEISVLKSEDAGCYEFRAINPFGDAMCTAYILIEETEIFQRRKESKMTYDQPITRNIATPTSSLKMTISDQPKTVPSAERPSENKSQTEDSGNRSFPSVTRIRNRDSNTENSTDNKVGSNQFQDKSSSNNEHMGISISGITTRMNRAARELESAFREIDTEELKMCKVTVDYIIIKPSV